MVRRSVTWRNFALCGAQVALRWFMKYAVIREGLALFVVCVEAIILAGHNPRVPASWHALQDEYL